MSLKHRVLLLLGQDAVSSVQESENSLRLESSSTMFHCGITLSPVHLLTSTLLLMTLTYYRDQNFTVGDAKSLFADESDGLS